MNTVLSQDYRLKTTGSSFDKEIRQVLNARDKIADAYITYLPCKGIPTCCLAYTKPKAKREEVLAVQVLTFIQSFPLFLLDTRFSVYFG